MRGPNLKAFLPLQLPVDFPSRPWPVAVVTLKNRTASPVVELFIDHLRAYTKTLAAKASSQTSHPS